jgi:desampylase
MGMMLEISRSLYDTIVEHIDAEHPREACGLLFGTDELVEAVLPCRNVAADPERHFEIDPAALLAAHRDARNGGPRVIGHYHSHPVGTSSPSRHDADCAQPDGSFWMISSPLAEDDDPELGGWIGTWKAVPNGSEWGIFDPVHLRITGEEFESFGFGDPVFRLPIWLNSLRRRLGLIGTRQTARTTEANKKEPSA